MKTALLEMPGRAPQTEIQCCVITLLHLATDSNGIWCVSVNLSCTYIILVCLCMVTLSVDFYTRRMLSVVG